MQTSGLWRDGKHLVVSRESASFPPRCIWTNEAAEGRTEVRIRYYAPVNLRISIWRGFRFAGMPPRDAQVSIPVSQNWKGASDARIAALGRTILGIGLTFAGLACLGFVFLALYNPPPHDRLAMGIGIATAILMTPAIFATVVGLAWPYIEIPTSRNAPMAVAYFDDRHVWIAKANQNLLDELPVWSGTPIDEIIRSESTTFVQAIKRDWLHIVGLVTLAGAALAMALIFGVENHP